MELYKYPNHRNTKYLAWLRRQLCIVCSKPAETAHHIRLGTNGGKGLKPSDYFCIPLKEEYHTQGSHAVHRIGEETFLRSNRIDKVQMFIYYLNKYLEHLLNKSYMQKGLTQEEQLKILIEKNEELNTTGSKGSPKKSKVKPKKIVEKVSITENEFYQKAKELKKAKDKELRQKLKESKPKVKVKLPSKPKTNLLNKKTKPKVKLNLKDNEFYQAAKEIQKKKAKKMRDLAKEKSAIYRKQMYERAKEAKKKYLEKRKKENE